MEFRTLEGKVQWLADNTSKRIIVAKYEDFCHIMTNDKVAYSGTIEECARFVEGVALLFSL